MEFKKMIFVLAITTTIIFIGMFGTSYAYYTSTGGTSLNVTTPNIDTGVAIVFNQSEYINVNTGVPISSSDVDSLASKSIFTLVPDSAILSGYDVLVNINLVDLAIANELKVSDFKYKLVCSNGSTSNTLKSGTGTDFTNSVLSANTLSLGTLSTTDSSLDITKRYTCTLSVWLEESGTSQNSLMDKKFSGLIKVNTMFKK